MATVIPQPFDEEKVKKQAEELAKLAEKHGVEDSEDGENAFSEEVETTKAHEAEVLNKRGMAAQIAYLLQSLGTHPERKAAALEMVENIIKDNADEGMVECINRDCKELEFQELATKYDDGWRCRKCAEKARKERGG